MSWLLEARRNEPQGLFSDGVCGWLYCRRFDDGDVVCDLDVGIMV